MNHKKKAGALLGACLLAAPVVAQQLAQPPATAPTATDMPVAGGDLGNSRYSTLTGITRQNVQNLGAAWHINVSAAAPATNDVGNQSTAVVVNGVIYMNIPSGGVIAVNGATGVAKWKWQPAMPSRGNHRGVAVGEGKVFAESGGRFMALDANTGNVLWSVQPESSTGDTITSSAPAALYSNGVVYFGGGQRYATVALNSSDGSLAWEFNALADRVVTDVNGVTTDVGASWGGCLERGGGAAWVNGAVDPELGIYYTTIDNARGCAPGSNDGSKRAGLNLFANAIVALDAKTGAYKWHYQAVHHDVWDMDNVNAPLLIDLRVGGQMRKVVYYGGKSMHLFVLDRTNGKPILRAEEKPVVQDTRQLSTPTQPFPATRPFPLCLVYQALGTKNIPGDPYRAVPNYNGYQPNAKGELVYTEPNYLDVDKPFVKYPPGQTHREGCLYDAHWDMPVLSTTSQNGGPTWPTYSYSPKRGLIYYPYGVSMVAHYRTAPINGLRAIGQYQTGGILALDAATNTVRWRNHLGHDMGHAQNPLSTAGDVVFVGQVDGNFVTLDATTGKELWRFQTGAAIFGGPITYTINGEQYVAITTGGGPWPYGASMPRGADLWAFKLGGTYKTASGSSEAPTPNLVTVRRAVDGTPVEGSTVNNTVLLGRGSRTDDTAAARDKGDTSGLNPTNMRVPVGTTVTFRNPGPETFPNFPNQKQHCATQFFEGYFNAKLNPGQTFTYKLDKAGDYFFNDCADPRATGMIVTYDVPQDIPGAVSFTGNTLELGSPNGVFTGVTGVVTARFAIPEGYTYEGDAVMKAPLSPELIPAASARVEGGRTLVIQFNKAAIDNNMPAGDAVPLQVRAHFRQAGAQKQLTSTATVKVVK